VEEDFRGCGGHLHRAEHEGKAVVDAAEPTNQAKTVGISHQEAQGVTGLGRCEVVCPLEISPTLSSASNRTHHQYSPPDVGMAEPRSAIATPTTKMNMEARNHPQTMPTGPAGMEKASVEAMDGRSPIILNAIPKTSIIVKLRRSSCLYPSLARFVSDTALILPRWLYLPNSSASASLASNSSGGALVCDRLLTVFSKSG
jgi:hypothetical protein